MPLCDQIGKLTTRGMQTLTWDIENPPEADLRPCEHRTFVYDGEGKRGKKTAGGETILYVNKYYEKNLTTGVVTTYCLGNKGHHTDFVDS